jgi:hypothetical protein
MNERIRELVDQSYIYDKQNDSSFFNKEKFAKLIIGSCIQEIENQSMNSNDEWEYGLRVAEGAIREHFGVEE